jgi:hypothetical protein
MELRKTDITIGAESLLVNRLPGNSWKRQAPDPV